MSSTPKIPQGMVLLIVGVDSPASMPARRKATTPVHNPDKHGVLVPLPESYEEAARIAVRFFGTKLSISSVEDIVLKRTLQSPFTLSTIYAEFDASNWPDMMVGPELEIAVFKSASFVAAEAEKESKNTIPYDDGFGAQMPYTPASAWPPLGPNNNPWLTNSNAFMPGWNNNNNLTNKDKTVQLTCVSKTTSSTAGDPTHTWESALICLPDSYEALQVVARQIFDGSVNSKTTFRVLSNPSAMNTDYTSLSGWIRIHPSAYSTAVTYYSGALEIRVDFEGASGEVANKESADPEFTMV